MSLNGDDLTVKECGWYEENMRVCDMKEDN